MALHRPSAYVLASSICLSGAIALMALAGCGALIGIGDAEVLVADDGGSSSGSAVPDTPSFDDPGLPTLSRANKVDILLAVDDSPGMASKATVFSRSIGALLTNIARTTSDIHLGVVTSSLGSSGGDVCFEPSMNTKAHLLGEGVLELGSSGDLPAFIASAERLVRSAGQSGCAFEAQLEAMYRFLVQPDPYVAVKLDAFRQADLDGLDVEVLRQRKAFLRPDSLLLVIMVTDEDDSAPDPMAVGGFGYAFASREFPGSRIERGTAKDGTTAPRATTACANDPDSEDCTSCGFAANCDPELASCQKLRRDANCTRSPVPDESGAGADGFYGPSDDDLGVRFHRMRERFGVDPQYPLARYVDGFSASSVPDRHTEHDVVQTPGGQRKIASYTYRKTCTNPVFASQLPATADGERCKLPRGPRTPDLVVFGVLGGAVPSLVATSDVDWRKVLGANPEHHDFSGIDPHMVPSIEPRSALLAGGDPNAPKGNNGSDPVTGREWNTAKKGLQLACTFALETPVSCPPNEPTCPCGGTDNPPLCATDGSAVQVKDGAYPSPRPLLVAKRLGARGLVGSVCPVPGQTSYAPFLDRVAQVALSRLE
ncbi:MAG: hypothetical protein U0270_26375 [Labilithrix sp.]